HRTRGEVPARRPRDAHRRLRAGRRHGLGPLGREPAYPAVRDVGYTCLRRETTEEAPHAPRGDRAPHRQDRGARPHARSTEDLLYAGHGEDGARARSRQAAVREAPDARRARAPQGSGTRPRRSTPGTLSPPPPILVSRENCIWG